MTYGEVWWVDFPTVGRRPGLIITRTVAVPVLDNLVLATVSTSIRGVPTEVLLDRHDDTIDSVVSAYRAAWVEVDAISAAAPLDQQCHDVGAEAMVDLRWVLAHLLEETARHAGHADILRELIDGTTGR